MVDFFISSRLQAKALAVFDILVPQSNAMSKRMAYLRISLGASFRDSVGRRLRMPSLVCRPTAACAGSVSGC